MGRYYRWEPFSVLTLKQSKIVAVNDSSSDPKKDRAEKLFQTTLDLNRNFKEARNALKKLQETGVKGLRDWIDWWFGYDSPVYRKALGYAIIIFAASLLVIVVIYDTYWKDKGGFGVSQSLLIVLAVTIVMLLLPSISKLKLGPIELDMKSIGKLED